MSYVVSGYFDGLAYEWSDENRVYTVSMSQQDYQQFLTNKSFTFVTIVQLIFSSSLIFILLVNHLIFPTIKCLT